MWGKPYKVREKALSYENIDVKESLHPKATEKSTNTKWQLKAVSVVGLPSNKIVLHWWLCLMAISLLELG